MGAIEQITRELLEAMGADFKAVSTEEIAGQRIFRIEVEDARPLIGMRGDTVHALDHLVKKIAEKRLPQDENGERAELFLVDVNDYRTKQIKDLQTKALMMAERARSFQYDVELTPMSAYERLIIHTTLAEAPDIKTESHGEGKNRRVMIRYSKAA